MCRQKIQIIKLAHNIDVFRVGVFLCIYMQVLLSSQISIVQYNAINCVSTLYIKSSNFIHLIAESLYL